MHNHRTKEEVAGLKKTSTADELYLKVLSLRNRKDSKRPRMGPENCIWALSQKLKWSHQKGSCQAILKEGKQGKKARCMPNYTRNGVKIRDNGFYEVMNPNLTFFSWYCMCGGGKERGRTVGCCISDSGVGDLAKTEVPIKAFSIQQTGNKSWMCGECVVPPAPFFHITKRSHTSKINYWKWGRHHHACKRKHAESLLSTSG